MSTPKERAERRKLNECKCTRSHFPGYKEQEKCTLDAGEDGYCDNCREFNRADS